MTWWRRQRVSLAALALAAVAVAGIHFWLDVLPTIENEKVTTAAGGQRIEFAGQRLSVTSARWDEFAAPGGMRSLSVRLRSSGGADASSCIGTTLTETSTGRTWLDGRSLLDERPDSGETSCVDESVSYDIVAVFVLPDDASGPFELDMPGEGEVARFPINP